MVRSNYIRIAALAAALMSLTGAAEAKVIDSTDVSRISTELSERWTAEHPVSVAVTTLLENDGIKEAQAKQIIEGIDARAKNEFHRYAQSLEGQQFVTPEDLKDAIAMRERIVRYDIVSSPRAFALNRPMTYVVTDAELARMAHGFTATWIEHEPALREKLDEMVMMQDLNAEDVPAVRILAREKTLAHAKTILLGMKGAQFFSAPDAQYYLESAFDEEIDHIRGDSLADPISRNSFLEEARNKFQAGQTSAMRSESPDRVARQ